MGARELDDVLDDSRDDTGEIGRDDAGDEVGLNIGGLKAFDGGAMH